MLILHVNIRIKPEHVEAFRAATIENARNSAEEPGVAAFEFVQNVEDPTHFCLWEVYKSEDAIAAHKLTAHYQKWAETVDHMFAEPRTRARFNNVFPEDANW